jgi:hypothetical protein
MARIRSLKPEIAQDAKLASVSRETRYHFVLLLTAADDEGFFRANARSLLGQLYPHDPDVSEADVLKMSADLAAIRVLDFVVTPDGEIGWVKNWKKHQRIDRPSKSYLRESFETGSRDPREDSAHGVLSPESRVLSPDHRSLDRESDDAAADAAQPATKSESDDPTLSALYVAIAANQAVAERWGERIHPWTPGNAASLFAALDAVRVPATPDDILDRWARGEVTTRG